ncbi:hypothetical protein PG984_010366 [Apiospora sp. TS-2023a]
MSLWMLPLLSTLGWEMAKTASQVGDEYGTAGPFISLAGLDELFALTCFHVLLPETENPKPVKPGKSDIKVSQVCGDTFAELFSEVQKEVGKFESSDEDMSEVAKVKAYDDWKKSGDGPMPDEPSQAERSNVDCYKYGLATIAALNTVYDDKNADGSVEKGTGLKKRLVGSAYAAPEYRVCGAKGAITDPKARGFLNDWALVKLDKEKFKKPRNEVFLGELGKRTLLGSYQAVPQLTKRQERGIMEPITSNNGFLRMNGHIANIQDDSPKQGKMGIPCTRVLKRGATTGLSFGVTNSIEACVRATRYRGGYEKRQVVGSSCSWELLVIPFPDQVFKVDKLTGARRNCFSAPGDSGAAVLDPFGTFIGQLVAGGPSGPPTSEYMKDNERSWRGQAQPEMGAKSGITGNPTLYERGKLAHEAKPEPEIETLKADMDVTFVLMAGQLMTDIERWVGKKPALFLP